MMKWTHETREFSGVGYFFKDVFGEAVELLIEVVKFNLDGVREEWGDVWFHLWMWIDAILGQRVSLPMPFATRSWNKFNDRFEWWERRFAVEGLAFHRKYLCNGSNYAKEWKVDKAISMARKEQGG